MDCFGCKNSNNSREKILKGLFEKVRHLQEEVKVIMHEREKERKAYERDMMVFAFKEAEWKQERKRLKEEVKRLKRLVEDKEGMIKRGTLNMEEHNPHELGLAVIGGKSDMETSNHSFTSHSGSLVVNEDIAREERVWRDEAVDKWKQLYLAIKTELDDLIQITNRGDKGYWRGEEEEMIQELKKEMKGKEKTIQELKASLALMEHEEYKRKREADILRQSLRIVCNTNNIKASTDNKPKFGLLKQSRKNA